MIEFAVYIMFGMMHMVGLAPSHTETPPKVVQHQQAKPAPKPKEEPIYKAMWKWEDPDAHSNVPMDQSQEPVFFPKSDPNL